MQKSNLVLLHLSLIDGVGPGTMQIIRENKPADMPWAELYTLSIKDVQQLFDLRPVAAQNLVYGLADDGLLKHELALIERHAVKWITILDSEYPQLLAQINAPPPILYIQGADLTTYTKCLAIIGARAADRYGKQVIESLVPPLVAHGWSIVSGGALGADAMAHAATLKAGGKTVVVLGSGLLHAGPPSNVRLFDSILAHDGTLLSTFPLDMQGRPENFPIRNRVISGISRGVIVVQAARKSGTRITAQYALEQGRDVFAVPGLIDNPLSEGCHALIQEGAKLISRVEDVLEEYGEAQKEIYSEDKNVLRAPQDERKEKQLDILGDIQSDLEGGHLREKISSQKVFKISEKNSTVRPEELRGLDEKQIHIITACKNPISIDDLLRLTNVSLPELQTILFNMQLDGIVQQNFAGLWEAQ